MRNLIRNAVLGAVIAAVPVSTTLAAVRPGAAVPTASTAVAAQGPVYDTRASTARETWPIVLGLLGMGLLVLYFVFDEDGSDPFEEPISPG